MFRGDQPELARVLVRARTRARDLGHPRVGSEHLLLALAEAGSVTPVLAARGATTAAIQDVVCRAAPAGAGAAADRELLSTLGIDIDRLLHTSVPRSADVAPPREPVFPLGGSGARRRCARMSPPIGLDAQAVHAASLQLALARAERDHRSEHLLLALLTLDPGADWALRAANVPVRALLGDVAQAFPPPRRNVLLRAERSLGQRSRRQHLLRRYQDTTGRTAPAGTAISALIVG